MKKITALLVVMLGTLPALAGDYGHKTASGWFDLENCSFCKTMTADPELLPHCRWETLPTADGMVNVIAVDPAYAASLTKACSDMDQLATRLQRGDVRAEDLHLCGYCKAYMELMSAGARPEPIKGMATEVTLVHATDPALIEKMHMIAKRNAVEMAGMMSSTQVAGSHKR